jgi:anti-sigma factor RsiW
MRPFTPKPMICVEAVEAVTAYLDGAMPRRDRARFETHLAACPHCMAYVEQIRLAIALTGEIEPEDLSPDAQRALEDVFRAWAAKGG